MRRLLSSRRELEELEQQIDWIVHDCPALPNFSGFHPAFSQVPLQPMSTKIGSSDKQRGDGTPVESPRSVDHGSSDSSSTHCEACIRDGDVREPFYLSYDEENVEYYSLKEAIELIRNGRILVGSTFIIPYPPGFPISVPGQVRSTSLKFTCSPTHVLL